MIWKTFSFGVISQIVCTSSSDFRAWTFWFYVYKDCPDLLFYILSALETFLDAWGAVTAGYFVLAGPEPSAPQ